MEGGRDLMDLSVELGGLELANPVLAASGTAGYGVELAPLVNTGELGGIILKSVTLEPRAGNPCPRTWETAAGMLNSVGLDNVGVDALVGEVLPSLGDPGCAVVASIAGGSVGEYRKLAARLREVPGLDALEVNVSCPNVERGGMQFGCDAGATASVVEAVMESNPLPVFAKLSAAVTDITEIARAAESAGAAGLSLINTLPGIAVDAAARRLRLGAVTGGLSGPAIKPVALKAVWDCSRATGLPVIGGGGVYDVEDVLEFLVAGASAVAVGTVMFQDPEKPIRMIRELPAALERVGASSPRDLVGTLRA